MTAARRMVAMTVISSPLVDRCRSLSLHAPRDVFVAAPRKTLTWHWGRARAAWYAGARTGDENGRHADQGPPRPRAGNRPPGHRAPAGRTAGARFLFRGRVLSRRS